MKHSMRSATKAIAAVWLVYIALIAAFYALIVPLLGDEIRNGDPISTRSAVLIVMAACLFAAVCAILAALVFHRRIRGGEMSMEQDILDGISSPLILVDHADRYFDFNRAAGILLDLDRRRDIGRSADSRIALTKSAYSDQFGIRERKSDGIDASRVIELKGKRYSITNSPAGFSGMSQPGTLVALTDITRESAIKAALSEVNNAMTLLESNALKIQDSSTSLSQGATEQAASLASITSFLGEINKKSQGSSDAVAQGTQLAMQAREAAEHSGKEISHTLKAMEDVQEAGVRIAKIVKLIDNVAFQTNLLALNAAVEAARAGRQGKGFAVVADEVRNLAGRSAKAAKDTAGMVEDITERIGNAGSIIHKLRDMLQNIVQDTIRMADTTTAASLTSAEQANGILLVNNELSQMDAVTHSTMIAAEQAAAGVGALTRQTSELRRMVEDVAADYLSQAPFRQKSAGSFSEPVNDYAASGAPLFHQKFYGLLDDGPKNPEPASGPPKSPVAETADGKTKKNWDIASELKSPSILPELLRNDAAFTERRAVPKETGDYGHGVADGKLPDAATGDAVIKPTQKIILDDSEFGRY